MVGGEGTGLVILRSHCSGNKQETAIYNEECMSHLVFFMVLDKPFRKPCLIVR
jgi:hypothetical protein